MYSWSKLRVKTNYFFGSITVDSDVTGNNLDSDDDNDGILDSSDPFL